MKLRQLLLVLSRSKSQQNQRYNEGISLITLPARLTFKRVISGASFAGVRIENCGFIGEKSNGAGLFGL